MQYIDYVKENISKKYKDQKEFIQAVYKVYDSIDLLVERHEKEYKNANLLERMVEPDNIIEFKIDWKDDKGNINQNNGYRVQFNNKLGPYKGGLRFHPSVNLSILKFLGFEQVFKNSLTTLNIGGAKGGSDFDPKGKSDNEIKNFCISFMDKLYPYIGDTKDVPAGDIGVGAREIRYLCDEYKLKTGKLGGVLTGKPLDLGGSLVRTEATGYGLLYIVLEILNHKNIDIKNKKIAISGSGNVAIYALEKAIGLGAKVVTMSDSNGYIFDKDGIKLDIIKEIKENRRARIKEYVSLVPNAIYHENMKPWNEKVDIALPCATQNEINELDAKILSDNGCILVAEGSNMGSANEAIDIYKNNNILYMPGKCANSGGVTVSYFEMEQNRLNEKWDFNEVDKKLHDVMTREYKNILDTCDEYDLSDDYVKAANITGFERVAKEML